MAARPLSSLITRIYRWTGQHIERLQGPSEVILALGGSLAGSVIDHGDDSPTTDDCADALEELEISVARDEKVGVFDSGAGPG